MEMLQSQLRTERHARQNTFLQAHGKGINGSNSGINIDPTSESNEYNQQNEQNAYDPPLYPESDLDGYYQDDDQHQDQHQDQGEKSNKSYKSKVSKVSSRKYQDSYGRNTGQVMRQQHVGFDHQHQNSIPNDSNNNNNSKKDDLSHIYGNNGFGGLSNGSESLKELWGELGGYKPRGSQSVGTQGQSDSAHGERLQGMAERSGLQFGANVSEFDKQTGLAKYGVELSDDDDDVQYGFGGGIGGIGGGDGRPAGDTVAYDSELDGDGVEDDDYYMDEEL